MYELFQTILYQPIFNLFVGLYHYIPDIGIVILLITALIKGILYPLTDKSIRAQKELAELQPKIDAIKEKHKGNKQEISAATMKMYQEHKINPFGSCLPILIQLPVFIALYWVLRDGLTINDYTLLYSFVPNPGQINTVSLGFLDLSKTHNLFLAILAGASQFWQAKMMMRSRPKKPITEGKKDEDMAAIMNQQMLYVMPLLTVLIGWQFPGGLAWYWLLNTLFTILQQKIVFSRSDKPKGGAIDAKVI